MDDTELPFENEELKDLLGDADVSEVVEPKTEPVVEPQPVVVEPVVEPVPEPSPVVEVKQNMVPEDETQKIFKKFLDISNTILQNYNADRQQIEKTIEYLDNMTQLGPKSGRVYVEMLVAALRTKAETNTNAVKLLDAMAKFLSAGKGTPIFIQQNQGVAPTDLAKLLEAPEYPDERRK